MRHRLTCPLYDEHPKHLRVLNHLDQFSNNDRGRELATLAVAGYELLYGKGEAAPHPQSLDSDIGMLLARLLGAQNQQGIVPHQPAATPPGPSTTAPAPEPISSPSMSEPSNTGPVEEPEKKEAPPSRPKPPSDPTPPSRSDLSDEPPVPDDLDDDDDHIDSLSLIGSKFG